MELFLSPVIVNLIVTETNKKIAKTVSNLPTGSVENDEYSHYKDTNCEEIYALFGLMYFRGLLGLNNHRVDMVDILFSEKAGHPVFKKSFQIPSVSLGI